MSNTRRNTQPWPDNVQRPVMCPVRLPDLDKCETAIEVWCVLVSKFGGQREMADAYRAWLKSNGYRAAIDRQAVNNWGRRGYFSDYAAQWVSEITGISPTLLMRPPYFRKG